MSLFLVDLTHASHTRAHTGVQYLCRSLGAALLGGPDHVLPVCHDVYESACRPLRPWERCHLTEPRGPLAAARCAGWPPSARTSDRHPATFPRRRPPPANAIVQCFTAP